MYVRWKIYSCPSCGKEFKSRIVTAPRVGLEYEICSCGCSFRTTDKEWHNMNRGQRIEYFLSIWIGCWLVFFAACGAACTDERWLGSLYGLAVGLICASPFVLWKLWQVKKSIGRTSPTTSEPR